MKLQKKTIDFFSKFEAGDSRLPLDGSMLPLGSIKMPSKGSGIVISIVL